MMAAIVKPDSSPAFSSASLDAVNFLLADVRGALGPYLNVFLVTQQHWSQSAVGKGLPSSLVQLRIAV